MFRNWGFLLGEIWGLIALATLLGLLAGWIIWAKRGGGVGGRDAAQLKADLERCRTMHTDKDDRIKALEAEIAALRAASSPAPATIPRQDRAPDDAVKPATLSRPRAPGADDLTRIRGIGPKLEAICHALGFYHYDQVAAWSPEEVAWVDAHLDGFRGRVTRDDWVSQARALAGESAR